MGSSSLTRDQVQAPWHWEHGVLTTGLPGKSPHVSFFFFLNCEQVIILDFTGSFQNVQEGALYRQTVLSNGDILHDYSNIFFYTDSNKHVENRHEL